MKSVKPRSVRAERPALRVSVHVREPTEATTLEELAERRVVYALARFGLVIRRVRIELVRDRKDVTCHLQLQGGGALRISVRAIATEHAAAVTEAIRQATQELARRLRRGRTLDRVSRTDPRVRPSASRSRPGA